MTQSEAMRAYWSGEWCGECRYGVVEDPPCCYTQPRTPEPETHDSGITEEDAHEWASESGER